MNRLIIITTCIIALIFTLPSCASDPTCITEKLEAFELDQGTCPGASVIKYEFQNKTVYVFSQGNCIADGAGSVVDENCNDVCLLGGIAGFTDCNGVNFYANAKEIEVLFIVAK